MALFSWKSAFFAALLTALGIYVARQHKNFDPQIYTLPPRPKLEGALSPNNYLRNAQLLLKGKILGPESILVEGDTLYTGTWDGKVLQIVDGVIRKTIRFTQETECATFDTEPKCGRPLGIRRLNAEWIVVVDTYLGVYVVNFEKGIYKQIFSVATKIDGKPLGFLNDVDVIDENTLLLTDSSSKWDRRRFLHAFMEQKPDGRVFRLDIQSGQTEVLLDKIHFANGIQIHSDRQSFLVSECSMARIIRYYFAGEKKGQHEVFAENLPGFPDNIRISSTGTFFVGLASFRHADAFSLMDALGPLAWLRRIVVKIVPENYLATAFTLVKPKYGFVVELSATGEVLSSLQDPNGVVVSDVSQVSDGGTHLYLGSFHSDFIAKVSKKNI